MSRMTSILFIALLVGSGMLYAGDQASPTNELKKMRSEFVQRLSPTEAILLKRIDEIQEKIKKRNPWLQPTVVIAIIAAGVGWALAVFQFFGNRKQRVWELLLESLRWFEGHTQKRSIGIALVESKWDHHVEFRGRWASILVNQAIYLLTRKNDRDAIHERANLYRIMNLLIEKVDPNGQIPDFQRELLCETLNAYDSNSDRGLLNLDSDRFAKWKTHFSGSCGTKHSA